MRKIVLITAILSTAWASAKEVPTGFQSERTIQEPTRLDWRFVARDFGEEHVRLPAAYRSQEQRYQLYVPPLYDKSEAWPLVVHISPGDAPMGWRSWEKVCTDERMLFCEAYKAGNRCPVGQRVRIVSDMLDQVRRDYNVDPQRTYITGFSGGGRVACTIGFALPEYFGGVIPVCGTNPLNRLDYLRHWVRDRLSVAFVTGEKDFNRQESELYMAPFFEALGIRSRVWVVEDMGHSIPGPDVLLEVVAWLKKGLPDLQAAVKEHPVLSPIADRDLIGKLQAQRLLEAAEKSLDQQEGVWRGAALLQGIHARWPETPAELEARARLSKLRGNEVVSRLIEEQGGAEERQLLSAQGKAFERWGRESSALLAWEKLAKLHPMTPEGIAAAERAKELSAQLEKTAYLGLGFKGVSNVVAQVVRHGPADKGKLLPGDRVLSMDGAKIRTINDVRQALAKKKPGETIIMEVKRKDEMRTLTIELGKLPR